MPGQRHSQPTPTLLRQGCGFFGVTCHLHFWQNDRGLLPATVVTQGVEWTPSKSQYRTVFLEKKILPLLLPGFKCTTFRSLALLPTSYPGSHSPHTVTTDQRTTAKHRQENSHSQKHNSVTVSALETLPLSGLMKICSMQTTQDSPEHNSVSSKNSACPWSDCSLLMEAAVMNWTMFGCPDSFFCTPHKLQQLTRWLEMAQHWESQTL